MKKIILGAIALGFAVLNFGMASNNSLADINLFEVDTEVIAEGEPDEIFGYDYYYLLTSLSYNSFYHNYDYKYTCVRGEFRLRPVVECSLNGPEIFIYSEPGENLVPERDHYIDCYGYH